MTPLLAADRLVVTPTTTSAWATARHFWIQRPDGETVAVVEESTFFLRRWVRAFTGDKYAAYSWQVKDLAGNRLLLVTKPPAGFRGSAPVVRLADRALVGRVGRSLPHGRGPVELSDEHGQVHAVLTPLDVAASFPEQGYTLTTAEETPRSLGSLQFSTETPSGHRITFTSDADPTTRALTLAWALADIQQRHTASGL